MDIAFLLLTLVFFISMSGFAAACDNLKGSGS